MLAQQQEAQRLAEEKAKIDQELEAKRLEEENARKAEEDAIRAAEEEAKSNIKDIPDLPPLDD